MPKYVFGEDSSKDQFRSSTEVAISLWRVTSNGNRTWKWKVASPGPLMLRPASWVNWWPSLPTFSSHHREPLRTFGCIKLSSYTGHTWCLLLSGHSHKNHVYPGQSTCQRHSCAQGLHTGEEVKQLWWEAGTHRLYSFQATPQGADLFVQLSHAVGESDILAVGKQLTE